MGFLLLSAYEGLPTDEYHLSSLAVQLTFVCCLRDMYEGIHPGLEIHMPFKLCSVLRSRCESSLSTYALHRGSVYIFSATVLLRQRLYELLVSFSFARTNCHCVRTLSVTDPYTFSVKPKWRMAVLWIFNARCTTVAYLCTLIPLGHSTVDSPGAWEVWWRSSNGRVRISQTL